MTGPAVEGVHPTRAACVSAPDEDMQTVAAILAGDEAVFEAVVRRYHESMVRIAVTFVRSRAVAEEVAQETWVAMLHGLAKFEGRSTLRTGSSASSRTEL